MKEKTMDTNEQNLLQQLFQLEWLLRRYHMQHHRDQGPMGAPYQGQGRILSLLKLTPEISQKDLAKILDIRSQSLGELLAKLERSGYITRTPSEADRRGMDIRLTEAGRAAAEKEDEPMNSGSFFNCLNETEQTTLSDYLTRLIQSLEKQMAGEAESGFGFGPEFRGRGRGGPFQRGPGRMPFDLSGFGRIFDRDQPQGPFGERGTEPPSRGEE
jgi:DNA-binding MarR family transcriptional regulator